MKKNEYIALAVLGAMATGFGVSLPFAESFAGGLCASMTMAGLVGGLADWFAVNAIFTKPLGISFKTNLIIANRTRLADGVGKMVAEELLSPQTVEEFLTKRDLATMAVLGFDRMDGRRYLRQYLTRLAEYILAKVDHSAVARCVGDAVREVLQSNDWQGDLCVAIDMAVKEGRLEQAGEVLLTELARMAESREVYVVLEEVSVDALAVYERGATGRQFVHSMMDLSPARCAALIQSGLIARLEAEKDAKRGAYWLGRALSLAVARMDMAVLEQGVQWVEASIERWLADMQDQVRTAPEAVGWLSALERYIRDEIDSLILDRAKNEAFNRRARAVIGEFLSSHQEKLARLAVRGVEQLSDRELTGFLRAKVGHDLQMIRVNGSLVGALVGGGLYLVRCACKAVML